MIQSGRTCVQMTEHIMLLRVEACCVLSWCSKQVNSLSVQSRYNAVEAWIVLRHRSNVGGKAPFADLFPSNEVSGARAAALFEVAGAAGAAHVQDLRNLGHQKHRHRNLLARLRKRSNWPKEHYAGIRVWMRSTQAVEVQQVPFFVDSRDPRCHWSALG